MILRNVPWDPVSQGTSVHPPNMRPEQYLQSGTTPSEVNTGNLCGWIHEEWRRELKIRNGYRKYQLNLPPCWYTICSTKHTPGLKFETASKF